MYKLYIQKEQFAGPENDLSMRKSPGYISWVRTLKLTICKEDPPKLYKIEIETELVK
jgi:hypothetical protein